LNHLETFISCEFEKIVLCGMGLTSLLYKSILLDTLAEKSQQNSN